MESELTRQLNNSIPEAKPTALGTDPSSISKGLGGTQGTILIHLPPLWSPLRKKKRQNGLWGSKSRAGLCPVPEGSLQQMHRAGRYGRSWRRNFCSWTSLILTWSCERGSGLSMGLGTLSSHSFGKAGHLLCPRAELCPARAAIHP